MNEDKALRDYTYAHRVQRLNNTELYQTVDGRVGIVHPITYKLTTHNFSEYAAEVKECQAAYLEDFGVELGNPEHISALGEARDDFLLKVLQIDPETKAMIPRPDLSTFDSNTSPTPTSDLAPETKRAS